MKEVHVYDTELIANKLLSVLKAEKIPFCLALDILERLEEAIKMQIV